jgi:hypothetical protein|uniref:Dimeris T4 recombination endonuclease VII n=1 Tax=Siphoviridae sp. ctiJI15 TaxID=2826431 RepID=A0A8S5NKF5_9CAUD|nr:MAG TPA: dimeris T4 recombination endonuclease VII [Siphoviridae sp. ctiJI15]DAI43433.1 MAG TPA: dimeris T4 recombination endonuclease VII [Caudoviricetes sp.]DAL53640.1 MAG TPA_asm: dimeris T4 recombination endonuclease VII [Bacteriophage sp.]DAP20291.1 MAG TPA: dimeris T4 recombination endonuclease VII [Caudoviricetes sp.]
MATFIGLKINKEEKETKKELTVEEIKAILTEKEIAFDGITKKKDLLALLPQE